MAVRKIVVFFTEGGLLDRCTIKNYDGAVIQDDFDTAKALFGVAAGATLTQLNAAELARNDAQVAAAAAEYERDQELDIRRGEAERTNMAVAEAIATERAVRRS